MALDRQNYQVEARMSVYIDPCNKDADKFVYLSVILHLKTDECDEKCDGDIELHCICCLCGHSREMDRLVVEESEALAVYHITRAVALLK